MTYFTKLLKAFGLVSLLVLSACATNNKLYYWGDYEPIIYDMYANPGAADPQTQIEKLSSTIQQAQNQDKQIAPGIYAHLGMIYAQVGDMGLAKEALNEEKALYPESAAFIDGMFSRMEKGKQP